MAWAALSRRVCLDLSRAVLAVTSLPASGLLHFDDWREPLNESLFNSRGRLLARPANLCRHACAEFVGEVVHSYFCGQQVQGSAVALREVRGTKSISGCSWGLEPIRTAHSNSTIQAHHKSQIHVHVMKSSTVVRPSPTDATARNLDAADELRVWTNCGTCNEACMAK